MSDRPLYIEIEHASKAFGEGQKRNVVLRDFSLDVRKGEFLTFFGPNGCGKTTLLNVIVGVESLDEGSVKMNGGTSRPRVGYVFQDYRGYLMPWLTVAENIAFPLRIRGVSKPERMSKVEAVVARFQFRIDLGAYTYALSGGQAQLTSCSWTSRSPPSTIRPTLACMRRCCRSGKRPGLPFCWSRTISTKRSTWASGRYS